MEREDKETRGSAAASRGTDDFAQRAAWRRLWDILLGSVAVPGITIEREQARPSTTDSTFAGGAGGAGGVDGDA